MSLSLKGVMVGCIIMTVTVLIVLVIKSDINGIENIRTGISKEG